MDRISAHQNRPSYGHKSSGGTKRQYILIFPQDYITEVWYKQMTEAVEKWMDNCAGGALLKKQLLQQHMKNNNKHMNNNSKKHKFSYN